MTHDELLEAIEYTMHEIVSVKLQIEEATGPREKCDSPARRRNCSICSCGIMIY